MIFEPDSLSGVNPVHDCVISTTPAGLQHIIPPLRRRIELVWMDP